MAHLYHMTPDQVRALTIDELNGFLECIEDVLRMTGVLHGTDSTRNSGLDA